MSVLDNRPSSKKRRRDSPESVPGHSRDQSQTPAKRKREAQSNGDTGHRPPGFWDSLSQVHLTRGAFREFHRRTVHHHRQFPPRPAGSVLATKEPRARQLKRFARHGGPDLSHVRGYSLLELPGSVMSKSTRKKKRPSASSIATSEPSDSARKSKSSYDPNFRQNLIDGGVYPHNNRSDPSNTQEVKNYLAKRRDSLSPSRFDDACFERFTMLNDKAQAESRVIADVLTIIEGEGRHDYYSNSDHSFNHLTSISKYLPSATPDIYDGALPERIDERVRRDLGPHIVPCNDSSRPAAPNFFIEGKGDSGRPNVAKLQACHDGAVGARAMHSLRNYRAPELEYSGNMDSFSSTFQAGTAALLLYGHHVTAPQTVGGPPQYHMTQLRSFAMTDDAERFREGATALRNLRALAESRRNSLIDSANDAARHATPPSRSALLTETRQSLPITNVDQSNASTDDVTEEEPKNKRQRHGSAPSPHGVVSIPNGTPSPNTITAFPKESPRQSRPPQESLPKTNSIGKVQSKKQKGRHNP